MAFVGSLPSERLRLGRAGSHSARTRPHLYVRSLMSSIKAAVYESELFGAAAPDVVLSRVAGDLVITRPKLYRARAHDARWPQRAHDQREWSAVRSRGALPGLTAADCKSGARKSKKGRALL